MKTRHLLAASTLALLIAQPLAAAEASAKTSIGAAVGEGAARSIANRAADPQGVRITALHGTGPDGARHRLFSDPEGRSLPVTEITRLQGGIDAATLPHGAYFNLDAETLAGDGRRERMPLAGAVVISAEGAMALGLLPQALVDRQRAADAAEYRLRREIRDAERHHERRHDDDD